LAFLMKTKAFVSAIILWSASYHPVPAATFTPLGDFPGGAFQSFAFDLSADGTTVVGRSERAEGNEAFRWRSDTGIVGIGDFPGGAFFSQGSATSDDGSTVVGHSYGADRDEGFRWTASEGMTGLGVLPGGTFSWAEGVSADGSVIVGNGDSARGREAFRWTADEGLVGLGDLPGKNFFSLAKGASADGSVVVGLGSNSSGFQAVMWTPEEGIVELGSLLDGVGTSVANGVSADGSVVVGRAHNADGRGEAFRWTASEGMTALSHSTDIVSATALDVSADGRVIVGTAGYTYRNIAFVWDAVHGMRSVEDVLIASGVDVALWRLIEAIGVSADGNTIAGKGWNPDGKQEAWIATLTNPSHSIPGDYNNNGLVEQRDLDLVLLNWAASAGPPPADWTNDPPVGFIDQSELDKVLLLWGRSPIDQNSPLAVPEPTSGEMVLGALFVFAAWQIVGHRW
jgi:probable HAF family extracellular repeat protein